MLGEHSRGGGGSEILPEEMPSSRERSRSLGSHRPHRPRLRKRDRDFRAFVVASNGESIQPEIRGMRRRSTVVPYGIRVRWRPAHWCIRSGRRRASVDRIDEVPMVSEQGGGPSATVARGPMAGPMQNVQRE